MKIGLIAFQNAINYGAVLQMYALKTKLESKGHEVEVINYHSESAEKGNKLKREAYVSKGTSFKLLKSFYLKIKFIRTQSMWEKKYAEFKFFRETFLNLSSKSYYNFHELNEDMNYDAVIVGSDQIWNPNITNGFDPVYFCDFNKNGLLKISYAASCGSVDTIRKNSDEFYKLIQNFNSISVREEELNKYVSLKTSSTRTLDPSLLLKSIEYDEIAVLPDKNKYLLIYKMQDNKELYSAAKKMAKLKGLHLIEIGFPPFQKDKEIEYISNASPQEFLGYFKNASFVITNSFHGTAFSIVYNKQFLTVPHRRVGQRMINLLEVLNIKERLILEAKQLDEGEIKDINYFEVNNLLESEISKSMNYLETALSTEKAQYDSKIYQTT